MMEKTLFSSHPPLNLSTNTSFTEYTSCFYSTPGSFIFTAFCITNIFILLPLCISVLYRGLHRRWKKRSTSSAATMSHSDCFTYHMVVIELVGVVGSVLCLCAIYGRDFNCLQIAVFKINFTWYGQIFFHILTCAERYLAVVHPITYMRLRNERGIRIRNASVGCAWLFSFVFMGLASIPGIFVFQESCLLILALMVISFCSLSVLLVLIYPGPGESSRGRERADKAKQRAFCTIVVILGVLTLRLTWGLARSVLSASRQRDLCMFHAYELLLNLPCSLVLPFLFLHRAGRFVCFKRARSHDGRPST